MTPEDPETQRPRQESGVAAAGQERAESGGRGAHGHGSRADTRRTVTSGSRGRSEGALRGRESNPAVTFSGKDCGGSWPQV